MANTENLKNLLEQYNTHNTDNTSNTQNEELKIETLPSPTNSSQMKFEYSPQKVEYYTYNDYLYRREIDSNGNISWEIVRGNITNKLFHEIQIQTLEKRLQQ